jgi:hypothetical protein
VPVSDGGARTFDGEQRLPVPLDEADVPDDDPRVRVEVRLDGATQPRRS